MTDETPPESTTLEPEVPTNAGVLQGDRGVEAALVWIGAFVIAALAILAGLPAFRIPLHGNDLLLFVETNALHRIVSWPDAMALLPGVPLSLFGLAANWSLSDGSVGAVQGGNLVLHALNGVLVFLVCRKLFARPIPEAIAMIAGLLFVANPLATVWVAELAARPTLQALCFGLLAVLAWRHAIADEKTRPGWAAVAVLVYTLAVASQFEMIFLPFVLILVTLLASGPSGIRCHLVAQGLLFFVLVMLGVARWSALASADLETPALSIVPPAGYLYFGVAAITLFLPWGLMLLHVPALRLAGGVAAGVAVLAGAYLSYTDYEQRTDPVAWWSAAIERNPDDARAYEHLVRYQLQAEEAPLDDMTAALREMQRIEPENAWVAKELGRLLLAQQATEASLEVTLAALRLDPFADDAAFHAALAHEALYQTTGDRAHLRDALDYYARADETDGLNEGQSIRYAMALRQWGDLESAARLLARVDPEGMPEPIVQQVRQMQVALGALAQARENAQEKLVAGDTLGGLLAQSEVSLIQGSPLTAFYMVDRVLDREPDNAEAWTLMGTASAQLGYADEFLARFGAKVTDLEAWGELTTRAASVNAWEAAQQYLEYAVEKVDESLIPEVVLGRIAMGLRQLPRAESFLSAAAEAHPQSPEPPLLRSDLMLATGRPVEARAAVEEARTKGASEEAIKAREDRLVGQEPEKPTGPVRTILQ